MEGITTTTRIEIVGGPPKPSVERSITIPGVPRPLLVGVHGPYVELYHVAPADYPPRASANDLFVGGLTACLVGTFASALAARGIAIDPGDLEADATSDIGPPEPGAEWIVRSVHLRLRLLLATEQHATAQRVHAFYHEGCWLSQTLKGSRCAVSSELELAAPADGCPTASPGR